jgi:hypothetical protein
MNDLKCTPSTQSNSTYLLDSGCTDLFMVDNAHCKIKQIEESPLENRLTKGTAIASTHTAIFDIPSLPTTARQSHKLHGLAHLSLMSVRQMCDSVHAITFTPFNPNPSPNPVYICHQYGDRLDLYGRNMQIPCNFSQWKQIHIHFM